MMQIMLAMYALCAAVSVPLGVLLAQVLAALSCRPNSTFEPHTGDTRPTVAVLVPAHNEQDVLAKTLESLLKQLSSGDRILVVADNCSDTTALLARSAGVEVIERFDSLQRGKGYALDFGIRYLSNSPPQVLLIIDADCEISSGSIDLLARLSYRCTRPVQALNLMKAPANSGMKLRVSEFAWRVKNLVRPLGSKELNWPCQLMGTGMAFPWSMARDMDLANGHIAEDMKLGADLALAGTFPLFCSQAVVTSEFPINEVVQKIQRKRWEHGHLTLLLSLAPRLLFRGVKTRNLPLFAMALDMMVPPLSLLIIMFVFVWASTLTFAVWSGIATPLMLATFELLLFILIVFLAWYRWGRDLLNGFECLLLPIHFLSKLPMYFGFLFKRQTSWVKTKRSDVDGEKH